MLKVKGEINGFAFRTRSPPQGYNYLLVNKRMQAAPPRATRLSRQFRSSRHGKTRRHRARSPGILNEDVLSAAGSTTQLFHRKWIPTGRASKERRGSRAPR